MSSVVASFWRRRVWVFGMGGTLLLAGFLSLWLVTQARDPLLLPARSLRLSAVTDPRPPVRYERDLSEPAYEAFYPVNDLPTSQFPQGGCRALAARWGRPSLTSPDIYLQALHISAGFVSDGGSSHLQTRPFLFGGEGLPSPSKRFYLWHCTREIASRPEGKWNPLLKWVTGNTALRPNAAGFRESLWLFPGDFLQRVDSTSVKDSQGKPVIQGRCAVALIGQTDVRPFDLKAERDPTRDRIKNIRWDAGEKSVTYQLDGQWYRVALPDVDLSRQL